MSKAVIGSENDAALLKHLLSHDSDFPLKDIQDLINWDYKDNKGNKITRKQVQSRLDYLRELQQNNYDRFAELCLENLDQAALNNADILQIGEEEVENQPPSSPNKREPQEANSNSSPPKKKRFNNNPPATMSNTFHAEAYGLDPNLVDYKPVKANPFMNGECIIMKSRDVIPSDIKGVNGGDMFYEGFTFEMRIDVPYMIEQSDKTFDCARVLAPHLILIETTVRFVLYLFSAFFLFPHICKRR